MAQPKTRRSHINEQYPAYVRNNSPRARDLRRMRRQAQELPYKPLISIVLPVYNPRSFWLEQALDSVLAQAYPHWELCVCDDASTEGHVREILDRYERLDDRIKIKYLEQNVGVSAASNTAISLTTGEFVGLLDHDDEISPDALFEVAKLLQERPGADLIYSDEDHIDEAENRNAPHFKPGWSPDLLMCHNYITHFAVFRKSVVEEVGGFREGFEGSQDYDLTLRVSERAREIHHIPEILYHWRLVEGSVTTGAENKPYTHERSRRALEETLERGGVEGWVESAGFGWNFFRVRREIEGSPRVSIIIPTRDNLSVLKKCLQSIDSLTTYPNYEVLVVDNDSEDPETLEYLEAIPYRVLRFREPFSHSAVNNFGAAHAGGEYLLLLNDDTEVISGDWLEAMLEHAQRPEVGAVGARLLFPDGRVQHAGVPGGVGQPWGPSVATHIHHHFPGKVLGYVGAAKLERNYVSVTGAAMMLRREVFEEVGGLDGENLPNSYNDVDLCLRIGERGYRVIYTPYAELYHHETASRKRGAEPFEHAYMRHRWGEELDNDPYYNPNFSRMYGDFSLRADLLRPEPFRSEREPEGEPQEMDREQRREHVKAQHWHARSSHRTSLLPAEPQKQAPERPRQQKQPAAETRGGVGDLPAPFFIVGAARSGTTWLQHTLDSHPEIVCRGEGMFFGGSMKLHERARTLYSALLRSKDLRIWHDMGVWTGGEFEDAIPGLVRAVVDSIFRRWLQEKPGATLIGDKTPHYAFNLEEVYAAYPEANIVHIIRDGRDVAVSGLHNMWNNARDRGGPLDISQPVLDKRDEFLASPEDFRAQNKSIFPEATLPSLANKWRHDVEKAREDGPRLFAERYIEVRYEDLLQRRDEELPRLLGFLGTDAGPESVRSVVEGGSFEKLSSGRKSGVEDSGSFFRKGVAGDWKNYFNEADKRAFKERAGELLVELGYEKDTGW